MRKLSITVCAVLIAVILLYTASANDGTLEGAQQQLTNDENKFDSVTRATDDTYVISPFESVNTGTGVWADNRHRAYYGSGGVTIANGFLLFDVTTIPDDATIVSMTLRCYLENAYGSPAYNPVVDVYYSGDDGWTRTSVSSNSLSLDVLLVDDVPFTSYIPTYDFVLDVGAHDWSVDLADNQICIGFTNDVTYFSYAYFFGAYGTPTGPAPELTIETIPSGTVYDIIIDFIYVSGSPVPPGGGNLIFDLYVENLDTVPAFFDAWMAVEYEGGAPTTLLVRSFENYLPGWTINRPGMYYPVPGAWAGGNYVLWGRVGNEPSDVWDEDSIAFVKTGAADAGILPFTVEGVPNPFDVIDTGSEVSVESYELLGNYPNPFNPTTTIGYAIPEVSNVTLTVYDISGREVERLVDGIREAGNHEAVFDASDLSSGVYLYQLTAGEFNAVGKLALIK
ncbi:T9SS type A sorting domain-containing protein [bacterium]|nr:T9SS type A sorting domain-containing protein [bacterium]MBU1652426.1 T9SS type A sorting domain-containing protein [bacterium]